eukprot:11980974-Prorocentrum_lima.AAC.1
MLLSQQGAQVDAVHKTSQTALIAATQNGHIEVVLTLLSHGASMGAADSNGWTALHHAAEKGH